LVEICQNHPIQIRDQNQLYVGADPALGLKPAPYTLAVELRRIFLTEREDREGKMEEKGEEQEEGAGGRTEMKPT